MTWQQQVTVYLPDDSVSTYGVGDYVYGRDVLPGFKVMVGEFFER